MSSDAVDKPDMIYKTTCHFDVTVHKQVNSQYSLVNNDYYSLPVTDAIQNPSRLSLPTFGRLEQICRNRSTQIQRLKRRCHMQAGSTVCQRHAQSLIASQESWQVHGDVGQQFSPNSDSSSVPMTKSRHYSLPLEPKVTFDGNGRDKLCQNCSSNTSISVQRDRFEMAPCSNENMSSWENINGCEGIAKIANHAQTSESEAEALARVKTFVLNQTPIYSYGMKLPQKETINDPMEDTVKHASLDVLMKTFSNGEETNCNHSKRQSFRVSSESGYSTQNGDQLVEKQSDAQESEAGLVVIIGGASDKGKLIADHFIQRRYAIILLDVDFERCARTTAQLQNIAPFCCIGFQWCDVSDQGELKSCLLEIKRRHGLFDYLFHLVKANQSTRQFTDYQLDIGMSSKILCANLMNESLGKENSAVVLTSEAPGCSSDSGDDICTAASSAVIGFTKTFAIPSSRLRVRVNTVCAEEDAASIDVASAILGVTENEELLNGIVLIVQKDGYLSLLESD